MTTIAPEILDQARQLALRCVDDFEFFARTCLKIRTKKGDVIPFKLNRCQRHLHERLEKQRLEKGRVRAVIVKSRQQGSSTYIEARFYWRLWGSHLALRAFILTHHDDATKNLFGMAQRFQDLMPAHMKPKTKAANANELVFAANDCGYQVATAGSKAVGRSSTLQLFHGSEIPSWPNAEEHVSSVLSTALANEPGTESVLESTAKGVANVFYRYAMDAQAGKSEYELIFTPWFWSEEYETPCPDTFKPTGEWLAYAQQHDLTWEQLYWAFNKNREIARAHGLSDGGPCSVFHEEFPATADLAFQTSGNSFIPGSKVMAARKPEEEIIGRGPIILGIDPARDRDRVGIIDRCGRRMGQRISEAWAPEGDLVYLAQRIAGVIRRVNPDIVAVDIGGAGAGVYDLLVDMGFDEKVYPVNFGSAPAGKGPTGERMYENRRAEMWDEMREWFESPGGVQIPDDDELAMDLTAPIWGPSATRENSNNALMLERKDKIKERLGGRSPDRGDAAALTFAVPFASGMQTANVAPKQRKVRNPRGGY